MRLLYGSGESITLFFGIQKYFLKAQKLRNAFEVSTQKNEHAVISEYRLINKKLRTFFSPGAGISIIQVVVCLIFFLHFFLPKPDPQSRKIFGNNPKLWTGAHTKGATLNNFYQPPSFVQAHFMHQGYANAC